MFPMNHMRSKTVRSLSLHLLQAGALEAGDVLWEESCFYVRAPHSVPPRILHVVDSVVVVARYVPHRFLASITLNKKDFIPARQSSDELLDWNSYPRVSLLMNCLTGNTTHIPNLL